MFTLKQDDVVTVNILSLGNDAMGIAKWEDWTIFLPFVCVGEIVQAKITFANKKKKIAFAKALKIEKPSCDRITPSCNRFGVCGGCSLQHVKYQEQLVQKAKWVQENFRKIAKLNIDLPEICASVKIFGYRNKIALPCVRVKGKNVVGLFQKDTHKVIETEDCLLCDDWAKKVARICKNFMDDNGYTAFDEKTKTGVFKHVVARYLDEQLLLTMVVSSKQKVDYAPLIEELKKNFKTFGLFENLNLLKNNVILDGKSKYVYGIKNIESKANEINFSLSCDSFFQVNTLTKDLLYDFVKTTIENFSTEFLIDCFSGVGLLSATLYDPKYETHAIEIEPSAVNDANTMKKRNNLDKLFNHCGDVTQVLPEILQGRKEKTTLVVDPPRKGLNKTIIDCICQNNVNNVVYVSCDSATLARDVKQFVENGFEMNKVECYDLFPHTTHVESVVCLTKK